MSRMLRNRVCRALPGSNFGTHTRPEGLGRMAVEGVTCRFGLSGATCLNLPGTNGCVKENISRIGENPYLAKSAGASATRLWRRSSKLRTHSHDTLCSVPYHLPKRPEAKPSCIHCPAPVTSRDLHPPDNLEAGRNERSPVL